MPCIDLLPQKHYNDFAYEGASLNWQWIESLRSPSARRSRSAKIRAVAFFLKPQYNAYMAVEKRFTRREDFNEPKVLLWIKAVARAWFGGDEDKAWEMILKEEATKPPAKLVPRDDQSRVHLSIKKK